MIENLLEALQNLNYNDVQTLDLTKEEDNKKFKDANEIIFYNVFSISIVLILLILVIVLFFANDFNEIMNLIGTYF